VSFAGSKDRIPPKLTFGVLIKTAFGATFIQPRIFARSLAWPFVLSLVLSLVAPALAPTASAAMPLQIGATAVHAFGLLPFALFGVTFHRRLLSTRQAATPTHITTARATAVSFAYLLFVLCIVALASAVSVFFLTLGPMYFLSGTATLFFANLAVLLPLRLTMPWHFLLQIGFWAKGHDSLMSLGVFTAAGPFVIPFGSFMPWLLLLSLPVLYCLARFSLVFPAVSLGRHLGLRGSWRLTQGSGLQLFTALMAVAVFSLAVRILFLFAFPKGLYHLVSSFGITMTHGDPVYWCLVAATHLGEFVLIYASVALIVTALAEAYERLTGKPGATNAVDLNIPTGANPPP